jgi:predicted PhzF superfamily epimerase YddE/YHI9
MRQCESAATYIVAAFTDVPFRGNPAGVCILSAPVDERSMQAIAAELRQPETAFLIRQGGGWAIRWFSPVTEVELCGHATLAAAHILWQAGEKADELRFTSRTGVSLTARRDRTGSIWLTLPAVPGRVADVPAALAACVGTEWIAASRHSDRWVLECGDAALVRAAQPDFPLLVETGIRSLILTAISDSPHYQIVSRNFAPIVGVDEDQVTGTAHACLAPYWLDRLGPNLACWQASPRGGAVLTRLLGDEVSVGGRAVTAFAGAFTAL